MRFRTIMMTTSWILAVGLALSAVAAAQTPEQRIQTAIDRAREVGIPVSLLESKKAEGQAKGVPIERIAGAIETRLQHLEKAQQALTRGAKDVDAAQLSVAADAIGAGVSESVLTELAASTGRDRRSVALAALSYLVSRQGLASDTALDRVKQALARGPQALTDLVTRSGPAATSAPDHVPAAAGNRNGPPASVPAPGQTKSPRPSGPRNPSSAAGSPAPPAGRP